MNTKDIEFLVHRIISGDQFFFYENQDYLLTKPSLALKLAADALYQQAYTDNLFNNFYLAEDIEQLLIQFDIATPFLKTDIANTEKSLNKAKIELFKNWIDSKKRKTHKKEIDKIRSRLTALYNTQHSLEIGRAHV